MFFTPELFDDEEDEEDEVQGVVPSPPCRTDSPVAAMSIGLTPGQTKDVEECVVSNGHGDGVVSVSVREDSAGPEQSLCHRPQSSSHSSRVEEQAEAAGPLCQPQTESPCQQREECERTQAGTRAHRLSRSSRQRAAPTPSGKGHLTTPPITLSAASPQ